MDPHKRELCGQKPVVDRVQHLADLTLMIAFHEIDTHLKMAVHRMPLHLVGLQVQRERRSALLIRDLDSERTGASVAVPLHDDEAVVTADQNLGGVVLMFRCDDVVPRRLQHGAVNVD